MRPSRRCERLRCRCLSRSARFRPLLTLALRLRDAQWKDGSRGLAGGKEGARPGGGNKALSAAKRFQPYSCKCAVCKQSLHQQGIYCQTCAYAKGAPRRRRRKSARLRVVARFQAVCRPFADALRCVCCAGVCAMCGIQILDVTYYKQSGVGDVDAAAKRREEDNEKFKAEVQQAEAKRACVTPPLSLIDSSSC